MSFKIPCRGAVEEMALPEESKYLCASVAQVRRRRSEDGYDGKSMCDCAGSRHSVPAHPDGGSQCWEENSATDLTVYAFPNIIRLAIKMELFDLPPIM
jgi:hypothetical protein